MMCVQLCPPHVKEREMNSLSSSKFLTCFAKPRSQLRILEVVVCAPRRLTSLCITASLLLIVCAGVVRPQSEGMVVATVHGTELRPAEVDANATARIFALQQQIYTLRKSTLENLISRGSLGLLATQTSQASPSRLSSAL